MAMRRMARRSTTRRVRSSRRKRVWAKQVVEDVIFPFGPGNYRAYDLLSGWKASMGLNMPIPGMSIATIHVDYSILVTLSPSREIPPSTGLRWGLIAGGYNDSAGPNLPPSPLVQPHEDWMWWENTYVTPAGSGTSTQATSTGLAGRGDGPLIVRSRRKLDELGDSLFFVTAASGFGTPPASEDDEFSYSFTFSTLLLMP